MSQPTLKVKHYLNGKEISIDMTKPVTEITMDWTNKSPVDTKGLIFQNNTASKILP